MQALVDFDDSGTARKSGEEWQVEGPRTYYPRPECKVLGVVEPHIITYGTALRLRAKQVLTDRNGNERVSGVYMNSNKMYINRHHLMCI